MSSSEFFVRDDVSEPTAPTFSNSNLDERRSDYGKSLRGSMGGNSAHHFSPLPVLSYISSFLDRLSPLPVLSYISSFLDRLSKAKANSARLLKQHLREKNRISVQLSRATLTSSQQDEVREKNRLARSNARRKQTSSIPTELALTPKQKITLPPKQREKHRILVQRARATLTTSQQQEERKKNTLARSKARRKKSESLAHQGVYIFIYSVAYIFPKAALDTSSRAAPGTSDPLGMNLQERIPNRIRKRIPGFSYGGVLGWELSYCMGWGHRQKFCRKHRDITFPPGQIFTSCSPGSGSCICGSCDFGILVIYTYICECMSFLFVCF